MKRKIFSKLLMGALLVASVSSFVSCKDYDDDINNLQDQINAKAALSELSALQSTLDSKIAAAQSAAQAAQATADKAATATSVAELKAALEKAIADAKQAGTDAGTEAGKAITAANKAQETADAAAAAAKKADEDAKAALAKALEDIKAAYATKAEAAAAQSTADAAKTAAEAAQKAADAAKAVADAAYTKAEAEELKKEVEELKSTLEAQIDEKIKEAIKEVDNAAASVEAIWSAVTSIELVPSYSSNAGSLRASTLYFLKGKEVTNDFGALKAPAGNGTLVYDGNTIAEIKHYKKGDDIKFANRIIVRVNPVNASFTADDVKLINSNGEANLADYVDVTVEPYTQLITRADSKAGLYAITFTRKAATTEADLQKATQGDEYDAEDNPLCAGNVLYAIAINNTKDAAEERFAATTFDVDIFYGDYVRADDFFFTVTDSEDTNSITTLKNRWRSATGKLEGEDETKEVGTYDGAWRYEKAWAANTASDDHVDLTAEDATKTNFVKSDSRWGQAFAKVDGNNRSFTINAINPYNINGHQINGIQWYYVTLDRYAAVESAPSEFQAWNSYEYDGMWTVTPATDPLTITVKSEEATGDIIGFRVFAVNYDGSLADPDGKAFYVQIGEPQDVENVTIHGSWIARVNGGAWNAAAGVGDDALYNNLAAAKLADPQGNTNIVAWSKPANIPDVTLGTVNGNVTINGAITGDNRTKFVYETTAGNRRNLWWQLLDANKNPLVAGVSKLSQVAYIAAGFQNSLKWVDGATYTVGRIAQIIDNDHHGKVIANVYVDITKLLPTAPKTAFSWKYGLGPDSNGLLNIYPQPTDGAGNFVTWNQTAAYAGGAMFNLNDLTNGLDANYQLTVTGYTIAGAEAKIVNGVAANANIEKAYTWNAITVGTTANRFVFNTPYAASMKYAWPGVSLQNAEAHHSADNMGGYTEDVNTTLATTGQSVWYSNNYAKTINVSGMSSVCFKDALEPGIQTYDLTPYSYTYKPTTTAVATTVSSTTEYMLFYNGKPATLKENELPYDATAPHTAGQINGAAFPLDNTTAVGAALTGETLVKYGSDAAGCRFVEAATATLPALAKGTNIVNQRNHVGGYYFTSPWNQNSYAFNAAGTYKANWVNAANNVETAFNTASYRARLISGSNTEYYDVRITAAGALTFFKRTLGASAPVPTTHTALLKIYAVDCFGRGTVYNHFETAANDIVDEDLTRATPIMELPIKIVVE